MPKSPMNTPQPQPGVNRLSLSTESVRGASSSGVSPMCVSCICFESEPSVMGTLCPFCFEGDQE